MAQYITITNANYEITALPDGIVSNANVSLAAGIQRSKLALEAKTHHILFTDLRQYDDLGAALPSAALDDHLYLYTPNPPGVTAPIVYSDIASGTESYYAGCLFSLPPEYASGEDIIVNMRSTVLTNATGCTQRAYVYLIDPTDGSLGSDIADVTGLSLAMSSAPTFTTTSIPVTATTLEPGDLLFIKFAVTLATGQYCYLTEFSIDIDIRG